MAGVERWRGVVLDAELDRLRPVLAGDLGGDGQTEIDPRRHAAGGDNATVLDHARLLVGGADKRQKIGVGPMRRGAPAPEQSSRPQLKRARAYRRHILGAMRLLAHEVDSVLV